MNKEREESPGTYPKAESRKDVDAKPLFSYRAVGECHPHEFTRDSIMGSFFEGRRRKFGIFLLAFALLLMGAWIRSQKYIESGTFRLAENRFLAGCSMQGSFRVMTLKVFGQTPGAAEFPVGTIRRERATIISHDPKKKEDPAEIFFPVLFGADLEWRAKRQLLGFCFVEAILDDEEESSRLECSAWKIPYLPVILFMTLVSSYFLLVIPRSRKTRSWSPPISSAKSGIV